MPAHSASSLADWGRPHRHSSKRIRMGSASARCTDRSPGWWCFVIYCSIFQSVNKSQVGEMGELHQRGQRAKYNHITFAAFSMLDEQLTFRRSCVIVLRKLDTKERKSHLIPKFTG